MWCATQSNRLSLALCRQRRQDHLLHHHQRRADAGAGRGRPGPPARLAAHRLHQEGQLRQDHPAPGARHLRRRKHGRPGQLCTCPCIAAGSGGRTQAGRAWGLTAFAGYGQLQATAVHLREQLEARRLQVQDRYLKYAVGRRRGSNLLPTEIARIKQQALDVCKLKFSLPVRSLACALRCAAAFAAAGRRSLPGLPAQRPPAPGWLLRSRSLSHSPPHSPALQSLSNTYLRTIVLKGQDDRLNYKMASLASIDAGPDAAVSADHTFSVMKKLTVDGGKPYAAVFTVLNSRAEVVLQARLGLWWCVVRAWSCRMSSHGNLTCPPRPLICRSALNHHPWRRSGTGCNV